MPRAVVRAVADRANGEGPVALVSSGCSRWDEGVAPRGLGLDKFGEGGFPDLHGADCRGGVRGDQPYLRSCEGCVCITVPLESRVLRPFEVLDG